MNRTLRVLTGALVILLAAGLFSTAAFAAEAEAPAPSWCILDHEHCTSENCGLVHQHCVPIRCLADHDHCLGLDCKVDHQHCVHNNCIVDHDHCTEADCKLTHQHCVHNNCIVDHDHCTEANCQLNHQHCTGHYNTTGTDHGCGSYTPPRTWYSNYYRSGCSRSSGHHHGSHH